MEDLRKRFGNKLSFSVGTHRNLAQLLVVPTDVSTQRVDTSSALEVIDSLAVSISEERHSYREHSINLGIVDDHIVIDQP